MRALLGPALLQIAVVLVGVGGLLAADAALKGSPAARPTALLVFFGLLYVAVAVATRRRAAHHWAWRPSGLGPAAAGLLVGAALQIGPLLFVARDALRAADWTRGLDAAPAAVLGTLLVVAWEELWFRGPPLNLVPAGGGRIAFAAFNGLLFAALHLFNPKFAALADGPGLFAAGAFLTLAYFATGSFYVPLLLHFGNNFAAHVVQSAGAKAEPPGAAGIRTALLLVASAALCRRAMKRPAPTGARW